MYKLLVVCVCFILFLPATAVSQWQCPDTIQITDDTISQSLVRQALGIDKNNRLYLIYNEPDSSVFMTKDIDSAWVFSQKLPRISAMEVNPTSKVVHLIYEESGKLYYGNNALGSFQYEFVDSGEHIRPKLDVDSLDKAHIVWNNSDRAFFYSSNANGGSWVEQQIGFTYYEEVGPLISVESSGIAHIVSNDSTGYYVIHYKNESPGGVVG